MTRLLYSVLALLSAIFVFCICASAADAHACQWGSPAFIWNSGNTAVTAQQTCTDCGDTRTAAATPAKTTTAATCMRDGAVTVTAYAFIDGVLYSDSKTEVIPRLSHSFTAPIFTWSDKTVSCEAGWRCTVGDETYSAECTVVLSDDETAYIASVTVGDQTFTDTKAAPSAEHTHTYGTPSIRWSDDYTTAEAFAVCADCEDDDPEKEISASCRVTAAIPPTCADDTTAIYTASAYFLDVYLEEQKTVILPRTDHICTLPEFCWSAADNDTVCEAKYSCTVCGAAFLAPCTVTTQALHDNCTDPGRLVHTAAVTVNGLTYTESRESALAAKGHTQVRIVGTPPTCTEDGLSDGLVCTDCGECLLAQAPLEATGHTEQHIAGLAPTCTGEGISDSIICRVCGITLQEHTPLPAAGHQPTAKNAAAPTCTEDGNTGTVFCAVCEEHLQDPTPLPATGHLFGEAAFTWGTDTVTASKVCVHGCNAVLHGEVKKSVSVYTEGGYTVTAVTASATFSDGTTATAKKITDRTPIPTPPTTPAVTGFSDVVRGSYYEQAVIWASSAGITQGTSQTTFSPDMDCSRAQIVTMLWRAAGCPTSDITASFSDVAPTAYYAQAVTWAARTGITAGTSQTTFSPDMPCSRAQIVTMLWRASGCPEPQTAVPFSDVAADSWYADAVAWAVEHGITQGTGTNTFSPDAVCTRAQIVTFLHRASQKS